MCRPSRAIQRSDDRGAYAVLYAVLVVLFVGITALVIDLGMLRMDRRANRAAADAAAVAGSAALGRGGNSPVKACEQAMRYAEINLDTTTGVDNCAATFGGPVTCTDATTTATATETVEGRTITVSWPIRDGDPLLTDPDREHSPSLPVSQPSSTRDGDPCQRIAVQISQNRQLAFATIWGWTDVTTQAHSVGLAEEGGRGGSISPMIALDPTACNALRVDSATLTVNPAVGDLNPGEISADSDGTGTGCAPGTAVSLANGGTIDALGTSGGAPGHIYTLEDSPSYPGCPPLCPTPEHRADPVTEAPWRDRYNCDDTAPAGRANKGVNNANLPAPHDYVDRWDSLDPSPPSIPALPNAECIIDGLKVFDIDTRCHVDMDIAATGDVTVNGDLVISGNNNLFVRGSLVVNGRLFVSDELAVFPTGSVEVSDIVIVGENSGATEDVNVQAGGQFWVGNALAVDDDLRVDGCFIISQHYPSCAGWSPDLTPSAANDPMGVEVGGDLVSGTGATVIFDQAFVRVDNALNLNSPSGRIVLVAPYGEQAADCDPFDAYGVPNSACFEDLALWADDNGGTAVLVGNSETHLDGTLYVPHKTLRISGDLPPQTAQLVADRFLVQDSTLNLVGDAARSTLVPRSGGSLIR
jgi:hypothetical protein